MRITGHVLRNSLFFNIPKICFYEVGDCMLNFPSFHDKLMQNKPQKPVDRIF